jgi:membrane protease YdiL (CAAX protease family)
VGIVKLYALGKQIDLMFPVPCKTISPSHFIILCKNIVINPAGFTSFAKRYNTPLEQANRIQELLQADLLVDIIYSFFFWFIMVSFSEEIVFRGYLQPRIYGIFKSGLIAVPLAGLMFALMHLPAMIIDHLLNIKTFTFSFAFVRWFLGFFLWHLLFNALYKNITPSQHQCLYMVL